MSLYVLCSLSNLVIDWHSKTPAPETPIEDPKTVVGTGYGESKWVAERLLAHAAKTTPLQPVIVRIGQLSGGKNGSWNTAEWIPAVVRSGEVVGALPSSDEVRGLCYGVLFITANFTPQLLRRFLGCRYKLLRPRSLISGTLQQELSTLPTRIPPHGALSLVLLPKPSASPSYPTRNGLIASRPI